jgi:hypothetical protein
MRIIIIFIYHLQRISLVQPRSESKLFWFSAMVSKSSTEFCNGFAWILTLQIFHQNQKDFGFGYGRWAGWSIILELPPYVFYSLQHLPWVGIFLTVGAVVLVAAAGAKISALGRHDYLLVVSQDPQNGHCSQHGLDLPRVESHSVVIQVLADPHSKDLQLLPHGCNHLHLPCYSEGQHTLGSSNPSHGLDKNLCKLFCTLSGTLYIFSDMPYTSSSPWASISSTSTLLVSLNREPSAPLAPLAKTQASTMFLTILDFTDFTDFTDTWSKNKISWKWDRQKEWRLKDATYWSDVVFRFHVLMKLALLLWLWLKKRWGSTTTLLSML